MNQPQPKQGMISGAMGPGQEPGQNPQGENSQEDYDIFVSQGIKLAAIASDKIKGKASIDTLGNVLADIVSKVEDQGAKHGIKFGLPILINGTTEILTQLLSMTGVDVKEEHVKAITAIAVGRYMDQAVKSGKISQSDLQQLAQQQEQGQDQPPQQQMPVPGGPQ
jgi:hypothetical protein